MLVDTPEYNERRQHLDKLKNRLEAMFIYELFIFQQMLVDTPEYNERCQHLDKFKNRLEAMFIY